MRILCLLIFCVSVARSIGSDIAEETATVAALAADDACVAGNHGNSEECSTNMLQKKRAMRLDEDVEDSEADKPPIDGPCLCLFDTDRTLTAVQASYINPPYKDVKYPKDGEAAVDNNCEGVDNQPLARDSAYPMNFSDHTGMTLRISEFMRNIKQSFCGKFCYKGILSVGSIGGVREYNKISDPFGGYRNMVETLEFHLNEGPTKFRLPCSDSQWQRGGRMEQDCSIDSLASITATKDELRPFILNIGKACYKKDPKLGKWSGACKVDFVANITAYYKHTAGVDIPDENVYFFDDACVNVAAFADSNYHARQISCGRRQCWMEPKDGSYAADNNLGVCGATVQEVQSALTGPLTYTCTVGKDGECDASYGCGQPVAAMNPYQ